MLYHISQSSERIHISNSVCFHSITTDPRVNAMGVAGGQNISSYSSEFEFSFFFVKCSLILLARRDSGELRCPATALIDNSCRIIFGFTVKFLNILTPEILPQFHKI